MATWAEQHEAIQTALEKLKSKKAEVKPIGPDLKNYKKPAGPAVDRCAKDKQWLACQEGRHQYNGKNFCGRCGEPRPKQVPVGDRRSRLHAALDAVMTYSKPPVIRKTLSILNPNDLAKMTGSSEPQYIGKGKPYTGFAKDSQHWMPETGNHALADKLHAQLTGEGFSPAFGSGNKAGDITYRYEKGKERAYLLARRNGQHTIERKAAGAYGKGLAKDAQWTPEGAARQLEAKIVHYLEGERSGRENYDIDKVCAPLDRQLRALGWKYNYTSQELEPLKSKAKDGWQPTSGGSRYVGGTLTLGFVRAKGNEFEAETWAGNKKACSTEQEARKWLLSQKEVSGKGKDVMPVGDAGDAHVGMMGVNSEKATDYNLEPADCEANIHYYEEQIKSTERRRKERGDEETNADLRFFREQLAMEKKNLERLKRGEKVTARDVASV